MTIETLKRDNGMLNKKVFEQQNRSEKGIETMGRDRLTELANMRAPVHNFIDQLVTGDSISNSAEYNNTSSRKRRRRNG